MKKLLFIFFVLLMFSEYTYSASNQIRYTVYMGRRYVYLRDVANYYGMRYFVQQKVCGMYNNNTKVLLRYEKRDGTINGITVHYLYNPLFYGSDAFISEQDFLLFIDPILRSNAAPPHRLKVIMIDPGHGAPDNGGSGTYYREKDIVLQIAYRTGKILQERGYTVYLTRKSDAFVPLEGRVELARQAKADIFVSIHANIGSSGADGIETYCITPSGAPSTNDGQHKIGSMERGNYFDLNNARLAFEIHQAMILRTRANDRGVKHARFLVIKNAVCPSVLIETGFLSSSKEERMLATPEYQQRIAVAVAEGIINYHNSLVRR